MLSIKKEVVCESFRGHFKDATDVLQAQEQLDSLIPILYVSRGSLQEAMQEAYEILIDSVRAFDIAASRLLGSLEKESQAFTNTEKFITGCRFACTANLDWR